MSGSNRFESENLEFSNPLSEDLEGQEAGPSAALPQPGGHAVFETEDVGGRAGSAKTPSIKVIRQDTQDGFSRPMLQKERADREKSTDYETEQREVQADEKGNKSVISKKKADMNDAMKRERARVMSAVLRRSEAPILSAVHSETDEIFFAETETADERITEHIRDVIQGHFKIQLDTLNLLVRGSIYPGEWIELWDEAVQAANDDHAEEFLKLRSEQEKEKGSPRASSPQQGFGSSPRAQNEDEDEDGGGLEPDTVLHSFAVLKSSSVDFVEPEEKSNKSSKLQSLASPKAAAAAAKKAAEATMNSADASVMQNNGSALPKDIQSFAAESRDFGVHGEQLLPLEKAVEQATKAIKNQVEAHKEVAKNIEEKINDLEAENNESIPPSKVHVSGLMDGDRVSDANGVFQYDVATGQTLCGKPVYARRSVQSGSNYKLFFHVQDVAPVSRLEGADDLPESDLQDSEPGSKWTRNAVWILGTSLDPDLGQKTLAYITFKQFNTEKKPLQKDVGDDEMEHQLLVQQWEQRWLPHFYPTAFNKPEASGKLKKRGRKSKSKKKVQEQEAGSEAWQVFDVNAKVWCDAKDGFCTGDPNDVGLPTVYEAQRKHELDLEKQVGDFIHFEEIGTKITKLLNHEQFLFHKLIAKRYYLQSKTLFYQREIDIFKAYLAKQVAKHLEMKKALEYGEDEEALPEIVENFLELHIGEEQEIRQEIQQKKIQAVKVIMRIKAKRYFELWRRYTAIEMVKRSVSSPDAVGILAEPKLPWNVRHPNSKFGAYWESLQAVLLLYVAFTVIYNICFDVEPQGVIMYLDIAIDVYFAVDVVLNLHTAYYDETGQLQGVTSEGFLSDKTAKINRVQLYGRYARGWLFIDVASILPVEFIGRSAGLESVEDSGTQMRALKTLRLMRLLKLLKLVRGMRLFKKYEDEFGPAINVLLLFMGILLCVHTVCCFWFYLGARTVDGWLMHHFEADAIYESFCDCYDGADWDFSLRTCLFMNDTAMASCSSTIFSNSELYIASMWNAVHPPLDKPLSYPEMAGGMLLVYIFGLSFGSIAGAFSSVFAGHQLAAQLYNNKIDTVKSFCKIKKLPPSVKARLQRHYELVYPTETIVDETGLLTDLPLQLRMAVCRILYSKMLSTVRFLVEGLQDDASYMVCLSMLLQATPALGGIVIVSENTPAEGMYFIEKGQCRVTQSTKFNSDTERCRKWIEQCFALAGYNKRLYLPNQKALFRQLRRAVKDVQKQKQEKKDMTRSVCHYFDIFEKRQSLLGMSRQDLIAKLKEACEAGDIEITKKSSENGDIEEFDESFLKDEPTERKPGPALKVKSDRASDESAADELLKAIQRISAELGKKRDDIPTACTYYDVFEIREQVLGKTNPDLSLEMVIEEARESKLVEDLSEPLPAVPTAKDLGPEIIINEATDVFEKGKVKTDLERLCEALSDGVVLCELVNLLNQPESQIKIWRPSLAGFLVNNTGISALNDAALKSLGHASAGLEKTLDLSQKTLEGAAKGSQGLVQSVEKSIEKSFSAIDTVGSKGPGGLTSLTGKTAGGIRLGLQATDKVTAGAMGLVGSTTEGLTDGLKGGFNFGYSMVEGASGMLGLGSGGYKQNISNFINEITTSDESSIVHVPGNRCAKLDDFVDFETGANRLLRQQAVVDTVLALAEQVTWTVNSMTSGRDSSISSRTIWPRLDEIHLGNVSDGDAFAELSLMPMDYFHQRTVTATTNTSLYYLEKDSFTDLSKTVPELARRMERMATRYKTLQAKKTGRREKLAVVKRAQTTSMEMRVKNIEAQLHNQGSSIETIKGDVQKILSSLDAIMASTQSQNLMTE